MNPSFLPPCPSMTTVNLGVRPNPFHVGNRGELVLSIVEGNPLGGAIEKKGVAEIAPPFFSQTT